MGFSIFKTGRLLFLLFSVFACGISAQTPASRQTGDTPDSNPADADQLLVHLRAAEGFQRSGNLGSAAIENGAVLGIALQRSGRIAIEEGRYSDAVKYFTKSLTFTETAPNRTSLAVAYLRQNLFDDAIREAKTAVEIDPDHIGGYYILGNIYYTKEDYESALPILERVFEATPDFEIARALGLSYLKLNKIEEAREHFAKMKVSAGSKNADLNVLLAKFYERTNFPAEAERELREAIKIDPQKPKANFYLGYLLLQNGGSGRLKEAGAAFEQELTITPNDFYSIFFSGVVATSENQHPKAVSLLSKAVRINRNSGEAHLFLAQSQIELGDLANAERNLRRAIELETDGKKNTQARRTHFMLGRLLLKTGRREEAKKELAIASNLQQASLNSSRSEIERILSEVAESGEGLDSPEINPTVKINLNPERVEELKNIKGFLENVAAQAYSNLGVIAIQYKQMDKALTNFVDAYEWNPDFPNLARNFGIVSFQAGDYEQSTAPLLRHLKANSDDILIRKMLASSFYFTKNYAKAAETLKPISGQITQDPELAYFYGISLIQIERDREAAPVFDSLARKYQQNPESLSYAAQGFMMLGDYGRASKEFRQVLNLEPGTPKANYFIGQSMIRLNRLPEAELAFVRELEVNPGDALSKYHLALTLIDRKIQTERAIEILREAVNMRPGYADAHYQLGKIYLEKGDLKQAVKELETAVTADADKDYIHYQLSIAYRKLSRKEEAARELKLYQELKNKKRSTEKPLPMGVSNM